MKRGPRADNHGANANQVWTIPMGRPVGVGGETNIRIVINKETTNEVITAFPVP